MYTLKSCIAALERLPSEILSTNNNKVSYRGVPILCGSLRSCYPSNEGFNLMTNQYPGIDFMSSEKTKLFLIQHIFLQECQPPPLFFKNGNVRIALLTKLTNFQFQSASPWHLDTPVAQYIQTQLKIKWNSLSDPVKRQFLNFCDEEGNIVRYKRIYILQGTTYDMHRVNVTVYKPCNSLIQRQLGELYVPKTSPNIHNEVVDGDNLFFTQEEWTWFSNRYTKCVNCNTWTIKENIVFGFCPTCSSSGELTLMGYSDRATDKFEAVSSKSYKYSPHLLGIELEYEQKENTNLKETLFLLNKNLKNHAIFKRDGSLKNGVEICTRPASIDIHLEELAKFYNDPLIWERLEVKSTCGMHIHIDRRKMTALTLGKLINFIQQKGNQSFIETVAERASCTYSILGNDLSVTSFHRGTANTNRYLALNTMNKNTAELRVFKTPTTFEGFQKNVEFASALTSFVQPANSGIKDTNYGAFLKYVQDNSNTYKELTKFHKNNF